MNKDVFGLGYAWSYVIYEGARDQEGSLTSLSRLFKMTYIGLCPSSCDLSGAKLIYREPFGSKYPKM